MIATVAGRHAPCTRRASAALRSGLSAAACVLALALSACGGGGGGGGGGSPPPEIAITAQPSDVHVVDGDNAGFVVGTSGSSSYEWQMQGDAGWADVPGATGAVLALGPVHAADSGKRFRVIVTSAANPANRLTSSIVSLTVDALVVAPVLQSWPLSQTVYDTQVISLNATATGTTLAYQWQHSGDHGASWVDIAGATGTTYTFTASTDDASGQYRMAVSNGAGAQTSVPATITVEAAPALPEFITRPVNASAVVGAAVTFNAQAFATPAPSVQWQSSYGASGPWIDIPGATGGSYTLAAVAASDQSRHFRAVATNANGTSQSADAVLVVDAAPAPAAISEQPLDTAAAIGRSATFYAFGYGSQNIAYQWQVSTDGGATFTNINGATLSSLVVGPDAAADDGKQYRVVVSDDLGSATSRGAVLSVMATPTISGLGLTAYWRPGVTDAAWLAAAAGPQLRYQWSVGSTSSQRDVAGATSSTFTLPASSDPSSTYICATVSNPVGSTRACSFVTALAWHVVNPSPTANALTTIARVDGSTAVASDTNGALLRTTDAGATWTTVSDGFAGDIGAARMAFNGQNGISVNGYEGIRLSFDGGRHWAVAPWPDVNWGGVAFTPAGVAVIVGAGGHIRRSSDQGITWSDAATDTNTNVLYDVAFGGGVGLAVGDGGTIRRSGDGGQTWTTVHVGGPRMNSIAIAPGGTALATDDGGTFWRSTDSGLTWSGFSSGTASAVDRVHFSPSGTALAGKSFGAILRSVDDGRTWTQVSANTGYVEGFASFDGGVTTAVGGGATLLRSLDDGLTWTTATTGNTNTLLGIAAVDPSTAVAVGLNGTIRRTADAGDSWSDVASPTAFGLYGVAFGAGTNSATGLAVGEQGSILRTVDRGRSWAIVAHAGGLYDYLHTVAWASANVAIAAGSNLTLRSTDGGLSWTVLTPFGSGAVVTGVAFGDALSGVALTSDGRVWHTADGGATWASVASSSPQLMAVAYSSPTNVTALGLSGAGLHSSDGGLTWTTVNSGFGFVTGYSALAFRDAANGFAVGNNIYATTDGGATWVQQSGAVPEQMNGVVTFGAHRVVAVGASGLIYESDSE